MLMIVTPTAEKTEALRRTFAKLHTFVYSATYDNFVSCAEKYRPDAIFITVYEVTEILRRKVEKVRELLPLVAILTLSNTDVSGLAPHLSFSLNVHKQTLKFEGNYFSPKAQYDMYITQGSRTVLGLWFSPYLTSVFLYGFLMPFTSEEVFLLRFLAERYPARVSVEEIARHCFTYGKKTPRASVASRISRINKKAEARIFVPIITHRRGEGYGIDF